MNFRISPEWRAQLRRLCKIAALALLPDPLHAVLQPVLEQVRFAQVELPTGVRMHYAERPGSGSQTVILLHGYGDSWFSYSDVLPRMPDEMRVVAPDLRGHGRTTQPLSGYAMRDLAADVVALMDALEIERAVIVGHSMGSLVAQQMAVLVPGRVTGVVLVGGLSDVHNVAGLQELDAAVQGLTDPVSQDFVRGFQEGMVAQPVAPAFMERMVSESSLLHANTWRALIAGMKATPVADGLRTLGVPGLLIWGDRDPVTLRDEQNVLLGLLPGSRMIVYENVGHCPNWERPAEFVRDITEFVRALPVATTTGQAAADEIPELLDSLGDHHFAISTSRPLAQKYFDQGLRLVYGFNHPEAIRAFRYAAQLDADCAMCWWGVALAYGPNINVAMDSASGAAALAAIAQARRRLQYAGPRERAYITALAARYENPRSVSRASLDSAYARAAFKLARRYPGDDDAAVLAAEASMLLGPWNYWTEAKKARPHGRDAILALERVLRRAPSHAGACHFYIHAVEAAYPHLALPCAERLPTLMPGAGHVVHMPAHIYIRVGRYADAIDRNVHALHADEAHLADMAPDGAYRLALNPHNGHFLSFAASMIGRSRDALTSAETTRAKVSAEMMRAPGLGALQHFYMLPLLTLVRFSKWTDVLEQPALPDDLPYPRALRHYARARAFAATGALAQAEQELAALRKLRTDERLSKVTIWDLNPASTLVDIAIRSAAADVAHARGDVEGAIRELQEGIVVEDALGYDEPPPWHLPVRQQLGAVLLSAGRASHAEAVFRRDLERHPENGWSLHGLATALRAQGRRREADEQLGRFERAWATADVPVTALRLQPALR